MSHYMADKANHFFKPLPYSIQPHGCWHGFTHTKRNISVVILLFDLDHRELFGIDFD